MKRDIPWAITVVAIFILGVAGRSGGQIGQEGPLRDERFCADANGDGSLNVTDAVTILQYLFVGNTTPYCVAQETSLSDFATRAEVNALRAEIEALKGLTSSKAGAHQGGFTGDGTNGRLIETGLEGEIISLWIANRCPEPVRPNCTNREYFSETRVSRGMASGAAAGVHQRVFLRGADFEVNHVIDGKAGANEPGLEYTWFAIVGEVSDG